MSHRRRNIVTSEHVVTCPWCGHQQREAVAEIRALACLECPHCHERFHVVETWVARTFVTQTWTPPSPAFAGRAS